MIACGKVDQRIEFDGIGVSIEIMFKYFVVRHHDYPWIADAIEVCYNFKSLVLHNFPQ
jgi:hypothetical protein